MNRVLTPRFLAFILLFVLLVGYVSVCTLKGSGRTILGTCVNSLGRIAGCT